MDRMIPPAIDEEPVDDVELVIPLDEGDDGVADAEVEPASDSDSGEGVTEIPGVGHYFVAERDAQAEQNGGVVNIYTGYHVVVSGEDGSITAMPPADFYEAFPDFAPAEVQGE